MEFPDDATGDVTQVQPMDAIIQGLKEEFESDQVLFDEVLTRSRMQLSQHAQLPITPTQYFETIQNNMFPDDVLDFLISLTEAMNYRMDLGQIVVSDVLKKYREQLKAHRKLLEDDEEEDEKFVGRQEQTKEILRIFNDDRNRIKVISICGMGGLGKTSLANKICRTMRKKWHIRKVDLREKDTLLDMLRDIVIELDQNRERKDGDQEMSVLVQETVDGIMEQLNEIVSKITHKTLLVLDNLDDIINSMRSDFLRVLDEMIYLFNEQGDQCLMRILITSRHTIKCGSGNHRHMINCGSGIQNTLEEIVLPCLKVEDAVTLFKQNIKQGQADDIVIEKIIKYCGRSPLAIVTLSGSVRFGITSPYKILEGLKPSSKSNSVSEVTAIIACLRQSFDVLNPELQRKLVQLSLFRTAPFDLDAAADVLDEPKFLGKIIAAQTKMDMIDLKSRHMLQEQNTSGQKNKPKLQYSFHPLMYHFLRDHCKENQALYKDLMQKARIRFIQYYRKIISEIGDQMDTHCIKAQKLLGENRVHVVSFYDVLLEVANSSKDSKETKEMLLFDKRMSELADILLYDDHKFDLLQKWIKEAEENGNMMQYFQWKTEYAQKMLDVDRNEIAKKIIDDLESKFDDLKGDDMVLPAVLGTFYYMKGRYYVREDMSTEAIDCLKEAMTLFRIKHIKPDYRVTLANVINTIGCAYFKAENYADATKYHQLALEIVSKKCEQYMNLEIPTYLHNLGTCLYKEGVALEHSNKVEAKKKYEEALRYYDRAIQIDIQMNQNKMDCHAQLLKNRAEVKMGMQLVEGAERDIRDALYIRRCTLKPPHVQLTVTTHKVGEFLYRKGVHLYHEGKEEDALNAMLEGTVYYEMTKNFIRRGGLPLKHKEYPKIKSFNEKLLLKTQETQKLKETKKFYRDFENGVFDKLSKKRRSEKETTAKTLTQEEIMGNITVNPRPRVSNEDDDDFDFDDDDASDEENNDILMEDEDVGTKDDDRDGCSIWNDEENSVNFDSLFKKISDKAKANSKTEVTSMDDDVGALESGNHGQRQSDLSSRQDDEQSRTLTRQGSSVEESFGNPKCLPQVIGEVDKATQSLVEHNIKGAQDKRRDWQESSMQTTSLETSLDDCHISLSQYMGKMKNMKTSKLRQMHNVQAIDEEGVMDDDVEMEDTKVTVIPNDVNRQIGLKTHHRPQLDEQIPQKRRYDAE